MKTSLLLNKIASHLLLVVSVLMLLSGFGITHGRLVEKLTLGILQKPEAFTLHTKLAWVFILLLVFHVGFFLKRRL